MLLESGNILIRKNMCTEDEFEPENIEQRNMFLKFKVRRIKGGAWYVN